MTTEQQEREAVVLIDREEIAKRFDHAAWKGFNQTKSEFEKGYKHAMEVAARVIRETPPSLLDSQAAGGDLRVLGEIRQRVADGYESASSRNVITVAVLALKDLHYVLSSHDGQYARGATAMRSRCVEKVRSIAAAHRVYAEKLKGKATGEMQSIRAEECDIVADALEAVTLEQQEKQS